MMAGAFKPKRRTIRAQRHIGLVVDDELFERAQKIAKREDISMKELARQAFVYALESMEKSNG